MSKNYFDAALDFSEDYKPVKYWESKDIEMVWFTRPQLNQFIKYIIENEKSKTEK